MGKAKETLSALTDPDTVIGSFCAALSLPLYLGGLDLLSQPGVTVYDTIAKKALGLFGLFGGMCSLCSFKDAMG